MKSLSLNKNKIEALVYALVWLLVFSAPYFFESGAVEKDWNKIFIQTMHLIGFLLVFLINAYILIPKFLFNKKYKHYFIYISLIISIGVASNLIVRFEQEPPQHTQPIFGKSQNNPAPPNSFEPRKPPLMVFVDNLIIFILILGAGTTTKLVSKWLDEEKLRKDIEKEQLKTNLALLRHQVSPHFFMNTLNNIHALIDINSEDAKDAIIRLSTLMRYLLYDSAQSHINLKKEIEFINSFISLMKLRFSDKVEITIIFPEQIPDIQIPPMLFISFLENAFKHGISYQSKSFIYFELKLQENSLNCIVKNSKHNNVKPQFDEYAGIGLENIKKSLTLLYDEDYNLEISDKENEFEVNLTIKL
jgi:hypothetical protein